MKKLVSIMLTMIMALSVVSGTTVFADSNTGATEEKEMCKIHYSDPYTDYIIQSNGNCEFEDMMFLTNKSTEVEKGGSYYTGVKFNADYSENCESYFFNVTVVMGDGTVITPTRISKGLINISIPKVTDDNYINIESMSYHTGGISISGESYKLFVWDVNNVVSDDQYFNRKPQKGGEQIGQLGSKTFAPKEGYKITSIVLKEIVSQYNVLTDKFTYYTTYCEPGKPEERKNLTDNGDGTYKVMGYGGGSFYLYINAEPIEKPSTPAPTTPTKPLVKKTTVSLAKASANLYVKGTTTVSATVKNGKGATSYKSSNTKVAKVDSKGKVTALKAGTAKITVTNNKASKTFTVTVRNPKLSKTKLTLKPEKSYTLKVTGKIGKATFTSSKKSVVKVNSAGKIVAKKKGKAVITVKTNGITLKCNVVVK